MKTCKSPLTKEEEKQFLRDAVSNLILQISRLDATASSLEGQLVHEKQRVRELTLSITQLETRRKEQQVVMDEMREAHRHKVDELKTEMRELQAEVRRYESLCMCRISNKV